MAEQNLEVTVGGLYQGENLNSWRKMAQFEGLEAEATVQAMAMAELAAKRERDAHSHGWGKPWGYGYRHEETGVPTLMVVSSDTINMMELYGTPVGVPIIEWEKRPKIERQPRYVGPMEKLEDLGACLQAHGLLVEGDDRGMRIIFPDGSTAANLCVDESEGKLKVEPVAQ